MLVLENLLTPDELDHITKTLSTEDFVDGTATAGWHAKLVKNNTQLGSQASYAHELQILIKAALHRNPLFEIAARPKIIHSIRFSRYETGMSYGSHVDNALMGGAAFWRSDLSFTIFLSAPSTYQGGELVIDTAQGEQAYKLEAGSAIVYPSTTLHHVETVTEGVRLVVVGWIQSLIRDPYEREILFDLDTVRRSLFAKSGKTIEFDLLSKCYSNLMRKWVE